MKQPTHTSQRHDDATQAKVTPCPYCEGRGEVVSRYANSLDPGAVREFRQRCCVCGGSGKAISDGGAE